DQDWRRKFTQILAPLVRNRRLELWDDTHIPVGGDWRREIGDGVWRAGAALLLVTGSYLASRFIMEEELPALVAHGGPARAGAGGRGRPRPGDPRALPRWCVLGHGRGTARPGRVAGRSVVPAGRHGSGTAVRCRGSGPDAAGAGRPTGAAGDDDVWSAAAAQAFRVTRPRGRVLYTTRDPAVPAAAGAVAE